MKVIRIDNGDCANRREYTTDKTNIRKVALEFGRANDTVALLQDDGTLVAVATWGFGNKGYDYHFDNLDTNPAFQAFIQRERL